MRRFSWFVPIAAFLAVLVISSGFCLAAGPLDSVIEAQKYNRSIHIMAMLLVGFGFLMVFVKRYGRSALTATFLLVSVALPLYMCINSLGLLGARQTGIDRVILSEFAAVGLLICAGGSVGQAEDVSIYHIGNALCALLYVQ